MRKYARERERVKVDPFYYWGETRCPLSPTLFGLHSDEIIEYFSRVGDRDAPLAHMILTLIYVDDIVLIVGKLERLPRRLDVLHVFAEDRDVILYLGKPKS